MDDEAQVVYIVLQTMTDTEHPNVGVLQVEVDIFPTFWRFSIG